MAKKEQKFLSSFGQVLSRLGLSKHKNHTSEQKKFVLPTTKRTMDINKTYFTVCQHIYKFNKTKILSSQSETIEVAYLKGGAGTHDWE